MRVFIDTNVFLDLLCQREDFYADSVKIFDLAIDGKITLLISDLSIANIRYITRKHFSNEQFYQTMAAFRPMITIVPVGEKAVDQAFTIKADDFEDALQYFSAIQANADFLLTRDMKDFGFASMQVQTPKIFLKQSF